MAVTVYKSTDGSAPVLDGQAGSLVNLLDKCLVTGYGAKSPAGWTKPFTGTNAAVFRQGSGCGFSLQVNDNGPGAGTGKEARVRAYEVMTSQTVGDWAFPTVAQEATGLFIRKSTAADGTARAWKLIADDKTFYLYIITGDSAGVYSGYIFGDFASYVKGDDFNCILIARGTENSATLTLTVDASDAQGVGTSSATAMVGHYTARMPFGTGASQKVAKHGDQNARASSTSGVVALDGTLLYPHPVDAAIHLSRIWIVNPSTTQRVGYLRGSWEWLHAVAAVADADTFSGTDDFASRTFELVKTSPNAVVYVMETSNTWDTSD